MGRRRESHHREGPQVRLAEPGLQSADERLVDQDGIEVHRDFGNADAVAPGRDAGMQVGQRLRVREPSGFWYETFDELQHPVGPVDKTFEYLMGVSPLVPGSPLVEQRFGPRGFLGRRQKQEGQVIGALEVRPLLLELRPALCLDQHRNRIGKLALRIALCRVTAGFDEDRPAGAEAA